MSLKEKKKKNVKVGYEESRKSSGWKRETDEEREMVVVGSLKGLIWDWQQTRTEIGKDQRGRIKNSRVWK